MALFLWVLMNVCIKQKYHPGWVIYKYKLLFNYIHQLVKTIVLKQIYSPPLTVVKNGTKL